MGNQRKPPRKVLIEETHEPSIPVNWPDGHVAVDLTEDEVGEWGQDAKIVSSGFRRRESWQGDWNPEWDNYFTVPDNAETSRSTLRVYREKYDALLSAMVKDIDITRARAKYTTDEAVLNAQAPQRTDIEGSR